MFPFGLFLWMETGVSVVSVPWGLTGLTGSQCSSASAPEMYMALSRVKT